MVRSLIGPPLLLAFAARDSTRRVCVNDAKPQIVYYCLSHVSFVAQSGCWCPPDPVDSSSLMRELVTMSLIVMSSPILCSCSMSLFLSPFIRLSIPG